LHSSAALVKFKVRATARKWRTWRVSIGRIPRQSAKKNSGRGFLVNHGWLAPWSIRHVGHDTLRQLWSKQGSAKLPETLDVSTIVDSIGDPANQWNWPLKAFGWA
jgi:hypothetical protein